MGRAVSPLALVQQVLEGRLTAVARMITHAESGEEACHEALAEIYRHTGKAHVVGITGVPGSGKSALVTRLCKALRAGGRSVGVIAVDPSSPFSGGSILGDRIRMNELVTDPGVFIRSMATRGALGGLARASLSGVDILDAAGYDVVLIETVGVGQDEIDVVQAVHTTLVVSAPGLGDDIQAIKAGVLEIADIHVVGKCDRSDAHRTVTDLKNMLAMGHRNSQGYGWQGPPLPTRPASRGRHSRAADRHRRPPGSADLLGRAGAAPPPHCPDPPVEVGREHLERPVSAPPRSPDLRAHRPDDVRKDPSPCGGSDPAESIP